MNLFFVSRRFRRLNYPGALLLALLQRTPALRVAAVAESTITSSPVANVLRSVFTAAASLGAIQSMAGATTFSVTSGTTTGVTLAAGTAVNIGYSVTGAPGTVQSWKIGGTIPTGLSFSGLTSAGSVNTTILKLTGTPTAAGSYPLTLKAYAGANATGDSSPTYNYTITVTGSSATAPSITGQPASVAVALGSATSFTVTATGSPGPTYQWSKDGAAITGATLATLSLSNVQLTDAGSYTVVASNSAGNVTSNAATLTITPTITGQPQNQTVTAGGSASFTVTATGSPTLAYQWTLGGAAVAGATAATLNLSNVQAANAGSYAVVVTNGGGTATSTAATLTVNAAAVAPTISGQPQNQTVTAGGSASFTVTAAGTAPLTYQWSKDGAALTGATSATLSLSNVQTANAGSYTVVVTNSAGTVTSTGATLTVNAAAVAPTISGQPQNQTVAAGATASFTVTAAGTAPLTYQWSKDGVALTGATSATLSVTNAQSANAGSYTVVVTNSAGSATSNPATLTVSAAGVAPVISADPIPQVVLVGANVTLAATVTGSPAPTLQWNKDGAAVANSSRIAGANTATLTINGATAADAGTYTLVASNSAGTATSGGAMLTVNPAPVQVTDAWLTNLSVRTTMVGGQGPLIVGLHVREGSKKILIRAVGPSLAMFGLSGYLATPQMALYTQPTSGTPVAVVSGWDPALSNTFAAAGAFGFLSGSADAAFVQNLNGAYTVQVPSGSGGTVLVEAYDVSYGTNSPRMDNVSARNHVGVGNDVLIEGFHINGTGTKKLLVRAVGPRLADFGVTGVLADPKVEVYTTANVKIAENNDWDVSLATTFKAVGAFDLVPGSKDAALVVPLQAGANYTVVARGADGGTGEAIVEVYEVP